MKYAHLEQMRRLADMYMADFDGKHTLYIAREFTALTRRLQREQIAELEALGEEYERDRMLDERLRQEWRTDEQEQAAAPV